MATSTEVREWARGNGHEVPDRGKLPARLADAWNAAHPSDPYQPEPRGPVNGAAPDYPDDDFESAFAVLPADPGPPQDTGEVAPKRPPKGRAGPSRGFSFLGSGRRKTSGKKPPRVSTEGLLGALWRGLAGMAAPLPPLQRTLKVQAPVAGAILDDAVKGTIIDPLLQPLARLADVGKAGSALIGPPVFVTAITVYGLRCAEAGVEPNPLIWQGLDEGLTASLSAWFELSGPKFEEALKREREFEEKHGQTIASMKEWLFSAPPMTDAERMAEEDQVRRAQGVMADAA